MRERKRGSCSGRLMVSSKLRINRIYEKKKKKKQKLEQNKKDLKSHPSSSFSSLDFPFTRNSMVF